jgi:hypothetical protein
VTKSNQPAAATVERVHAALGAHPRSTSSVANEVGLSPATTRKALVVLADAGRALKNTETGEWRVAERIAEPEQHKPAEAPKAAKADKAAKAAAPQPELTGAAKELLAVGYPRRTAVIDGAVLDLIRSSGPLTEAQCREKLDHVPGWSFRRLAEGKHGELEFAPLISAFGKGKDRAYSARTPESVKVSK